MDPRSWALPQQASPSRARSPDGADAAGNGFEIRFAGVRPASTVATKGVLWLNPLLVPVDTLLI